MNPVIVCKTRVVVKVSHGTRASGNAHRGFILMTTVDEGRPIITVDTIFPAQGILGKVQEASLAAVRRHAIIPDSGCEVTSSSYCHCDFLAPKDCNLDL